MNITCYYHWIIYFIFITLLLKQWKWWWEDYVSYTNMSPSGQCALLALLGCSLQSELGGAHPDTALSQDETLQ